MKGKDEEEKKGSDKPEGEEDEPKLKYKSTAKTTVRFNRKAPVLVTGNAEGVVDLYRAVGLEHVQVS